MILPSARDALPVRLMAMPARVAGFTLIELMVVVAVIGVLAAIAYPAYTDSVTKGKRSQGRAALLDLMQQQERYFTQNGTYLAPLPTGPNAPFKTTSGDGTSTPAYALGARGCTNPVAALRECVVVFAQPLAPFVDPVVNELRVQSTGEKSCTGSNPSLCW